VRGHRGERGVLPFLILPLFVACLAAPPQSLFETPNGLVRAARAEEARAIAAILDKVRPRLLSVLPGARRDPVEVWMQDHPHLYHFAQEGSSDAEGLYAPSQDRILLGRGLEDTERVLVHELVHASLGEDWDALPGTLEEGLCDAVAARLSDVGVARLRAGRLSSAALVCGGLALDVETRRAGGRRGERSGWSARMLLSSDEVVEEPQREIFRVSAGLSSTRLEPNVKRGLYGLSFLLVDRLIARVGLEGLHGLCVEARAQGYDTVPRRWLLEAAELPDDARSWGRAAVDGLSQAELIELARLYPGIVASAALQRLDLDGLPAVVGELEIELSAVGGEARARVEALPEVRAEIERLLDRP